MTSINQDRLVTYHDWLEHTGFYQIDILARVQIIPLELENLDPPTLPGCAYAKAHHKP